jgi:hypothetical protein
VLRQARLDARARRAEHAVDVHAAPSLVLELNRCAAVLLKASALSLSFTAQALP